MKDPFVDGTLWLTVIGISHYSVRKSRPVTSVIRIQKSPGLVRMDVRVLGNRDG